MSRIVFYIPPVSIALQQNNRVKKDEELSTYLENLMEDNNDLDNSFSLTFERSEEQSELLKKMIEEGLYYLATNVM